MKPFHTEHVEAAGDWYEIGFAQGRTTRMMVRHMVHSAVKFRKFHAGSPVLDRLPELVQRVEALFSRSFPAGWEELKGIAHGAGVDVSWLAAANFPEALLCLCPDSVSFPDLDLCPPLESRECGGLMLPSSEIGPLLGGTLDDRPGQYLLTARPKNGMALCCVRYPGSIATWGGMNEAGLVMSSASVCVFQEDNLWQDDRMLGVDMVHSILPLLHTCGTTEQALERFARNDLKIPRNLGMLDENGTGVLVQGCAGQCPDLRVQRMEEGSGLCWGNIWPWDMDSKTWDGIPEEERPTSALARYSSLRSAVENNKGSYSLDLMKQTLTSHDGPPGEVHVHSVCNDNTVFAMVAAPASGELLFASQPPCMQGFQDYSFAH